jgi:hypothetical protein
MQLLARRDTDVYTTPMSKDTATGRIPTSNPPTTVKADGTRVKPSPFPTGVKVGLGLGLKAAPGRLKAKRKPAYGSRPPRGL